MSVSYYEGNQFAPIIDLGADPDNEGNNLVYRLAGTVDSVPSDSVSESVNEEPKTEEETPTEDAGETTEENGGTNAES